MIHTVKGFGIVNKAEIDVFLELCCFFYDPADVGNLISGSSAFSKTSLNIWKFTFHILLKPGLENFVKSEVRAQSNKVGRLWFWGVDAREYPGELPRLDPAFAYAEPPSS